MTVNQICLVTAAFWLIGWLSLCAYQLRRYLADDQNFWEQYNSMYDCSSCDDYRQSRDSVLYLPCHEEVQSKSTHIVLANGTMIDMQKYMRWLRCLDVTRASRLMVLLDDPWFTFYVKWGNNTTTTSLLNTVMSGLTIKPEFLSARPCNIWCRFLGGPPKNRRLVESSLLNFIVDRVFRAILKEGATAVDTKIIEALNYKETLLLKGPE